MTLVLLKNCKNQISVTLILNILSATQGIGFGWLSPTIPLLQSTQTPFPSGPITVDEASWIGALAAAGSICGNFFFGYIVDIIGRKKTLYLVPIAYVIFWINVKCATNAYYLYVGRFCSGLGAGGTFVVIPLIVSEISNKDIRGILGSMFMIFMNVGMVTGYILSSLLPYGIVPYTAIWMPVVYILLVMFFVPETPLYLLKTKRDDEAERSLKFYLNMNPVTKLEIQEFQARLDQMRMTVASENKKNKVTLKDLWAPEARRGFFIGIFLVTLMQCSSSFAIISYAANILLESGTEFDIYTGTIIIGVLQVLGTLVSAMVVDKAGRKILLGISAGGSALGLGLLGLFCLFSGSINLEQFNWVPVTCLSFIVFIAAVGLSSLPYVIIGEVLPNKVRSSYSTLLMVIASAVSFLVLKMFPLMLETLDLSTVMFIFMSICISGIFLIILIVPETKGKVLN